MDAETLKLLYFNPCSPLSKCFWLRSCITVTSEEKALSEETLNETHS